MQIIEIRSTHDLRTQAPRDRQPGTPSYWVHCRQFTTQYRERQKSASTATPTLGLMTLSGDRIWITEEESLRVAEAIRDTHTPVTLD